MKYLITLIATLWAASTLSADEPEISIRLKRDPSRAFTAQRGRPVLASSQKASKFRIVPGQTTQNTVSFQLVDASNVYLRHEGFVLKAHKQTSGSTLFDADASFNVIRNSDGSVRFQSTNDPGMFLTVNESGLVILAGNRPEEQSTFVLAR